MRTTDPSQRRKTTDHGTMRLRKINGWLTTSDNYFLICMLCGGVSKPWSIFTRLSVNCSVCLCFQPEPQVPSWRRWCRPKQLPAIQIWFWHCGMSHYGAGNLLPRKRGDVDSTIWVVSRTSHFGDFQGLGGLGAKRKWQRLTNWRGSPRVPQNQYDFH